MNKNAISDCKQSEESSLFLSEITSTKLKLFLVLRGHFPQRLILIWVSFHKNDS